MDSSNKPCDEYVLETSNYFLDCCQIYPPKMVTFSNLIARTVQYLRLKSAYNFQETERQQYETKQGRKGGRQEGNRNNCI